MLIVNVTAVAGLPDDDRITDDPENDPVIPRADPRVSSQIASQRLDSADTRPLFKPSKNIVNPALDWQRQCVEFGLGSGSDDDVCHNKKRTVH